MRQQPLAIEFTLFMGPYMGKLRSHYGLGLIAIKMLLGWGDIYTPILEQLYIPYVRLRRTYRIYPAGITFWRSGNDDSRLLLEETITGQLE